VEMTFSSLLLQILQEQNLNLTELYKELNDLGFYITYPSLYGYFTGKMVPPFLKAKEILKVEKLNIDDEELARILNHSKRIQKEDYDENEKILTINLKIKPELIDPKYTLQPKYLKSVIEMRAEEIFGNNELITQFSASGKRKLSAYIAYLIKKDLEESGFVEEKK